MSSISQGLVLTTAMVLSTTVLYLTFCKQKYSSPFQFHENPNSQNSGKQILRSCLYSEDKKREKRKMKKKVKFSENVMVKEKERESDEEIREKQGKKNRVSINKCINEIPEIHGMPENRIALYNGILRDRVHRMGYCH